MLLVAMACSLLSTAQAQTNVKDLVDSINQGEVELVSIVGNGHLSGLVLNGYLINRGSVSQNFDIHLSHPLFLKNSGQGQNMVVTQIYGADESYSSDGGNRFLPAGPGERTPISLFAFCVNFKKENPTSADRFTIQEIPSKITEVVRRISAYQKANPNANISTSGQLALWVSKGLPLKKIKKRLDFSASDVKELHRILR